MTSWWTCTAACSATKSACWTSARRTWPISARSAGWWSSKTSPARSRPPWRSPDRRPSPRSRAYPGDADYFERVNIIAATREQACQRLAQLIRDKALSAERGPTYQLIEVKFGSYPFEFVREGRAMAAGSPISWTPAEVRAGAIHAFKPGGAQAEIGWEQVAVEPGWCKLDWVIADPVRGQLANASNMLDVTWEAPDGSITPLDGYLDPYFQEVYLEAESVPIFSKLARHVSANALDNYVAQLEKEVNKYLTKDVNYGKAAKRMYNVFRLTGRYEEAAFLRSSSTSPPPCSTRSGR